MTPVRLRTRTVEGMGARLSAMRARIDALRARLERERLRHRTVDVAFRSVQLLTRTGGGLLPGALAFRLFLFMVPTVFVVVMGLGLSADAAGASVHDAARAAGIAGIAATALQSGADASTTTRWMTMLIALFALITGARNLLKALWISQALIWGVPLRKVRHPARAVLTLLVVFLGALALLRLTYALRQLSVVAWVVGVASYVLVPAALWLVLSMRGFPRRDDVSWRDVLPGALVFGVGVQALHLTTVLWVAPSMAAKSATYGAIGAALAILVWAYLVGLLITFAAALNAALADSRDTDSRHWDHAPVRAMTEGKR